MIAVILSALAITTPWVCGEVPGIGVTYWSPVTLEPVTIQFSERVVCDPLSRSRVNFASAYALYVVAHEAAHASRPPIYDEHAADCYALAHVYTIARSILGFTARQSARMLVWAEEVHAVAPPPYAGPCPAPRLRLPLQLGAP